MTKHGLTSEERFWMKVDKKGEGECWEWIPSLQKHGVGQFRDSGQGILIPAYKYSYKISNGEVPEGMEVRHTCNSRNCVNPKHLFLKEHLSFRAKTSSMEERFWMDVDKRGEDECWCWIGGTSGEIRDISRGKQMQAYRYSYELHYGSVSEEMEVCHQCNNTKCVNPKHLFTRLKVTPLEERFWDNVTKRGEDECWNWTGTTSRGYGHIKDTPTGKNVLVHRLSYEIHKGPIPEGLLVRHKCINNRRCVNPNHLETGTHKDNAQDAVRQGRLLLAHKDQLGVNHHNSKLTDDQVKEIRYMLYSGMKQRDIAKTFSVSQRTIWAINVNKIWRHVGE